MSLFPIAQQICRVSRNSSRTPVLVLGPNVTLHDAFFVDFTNELLAGSEIDHVRFDWLIDDSLLTSRPAACLRFWNTRRQVTQINRILRQNGKSATIELTSQLSRPSEPNRSDRQVCTVGVSRDGEHLPSWGVAFKTTCRAATFSSTVSALTC